MHVAPGNRYLLPFWVFFGLKTSPGRGQMTKMAIAQFRGPKTRGTFDHRLRNFNLLLIMHVAPGNRDLLPFWVFLRLKTSRGRGRLTKMAIARFRNPKMRGTFDHRLQNFKLFDSACRKIC